MIRFLLVTVVAFFMTGCSSKAEQPPQVELDARRLLERGHEAYQQGQFLTATSHFQRALVQFQGFDHRAGQLQTHLSLATTLMQLGRFDAANEQAELAQELALALSITQAQDHAQLLKARLAWLNQDQYLAMGRLEPLLPQTGVMTSPVQLAALSLRTLVAQDQADFNEWLNLYRAAVNHQSDFLHQQRLERFEAQLQAQQGDYTSAVTRLEAVLEAYRQAMQRPQLAATLEEMGDLTRHAEDFRAAKDYFKRALRIRLQLQDSHHSQRLLIKLSEMGADG